jgi:hypothetical protein
MLGIALADNNVLWLLKFKTTIVMLAIAAGIK